MSQQGERHTGHGARSGQEDDWWGQLYDESKDDTGPAKAADTLDDRFASASDTVADGDEGAEGAAGTEGAEGGGGAGVGPGAADGRDGHEAGSSGARGFPGSATRIRPSAGPPPTNARISRAG